MFQRTKVNEKTRPLIVSDKEKENCICQNVQNLSYWNRYLVIYPHKCTLNNLKKKYQEKWENAYLRVKNARASRALRQALDPSQYWFTSLAWLCLATSAKSRKTFLGPPLDQILDPLMLPLEVWVHLLQDWVIHFYIQGYSSAHSMKMMKIWRPLDPTTHSVLNIMCPISNMNDIYTILKSTLYVHAIKNVY